MASWTIIYFPPPGEKNSPYDYITSADKKEQATIAHRLESIAHLLPAQWPSLWWHTVGEFYQLRATNSRLLFIIDGNLIVILHAFAKKSKKTPKEEINRATLNHNAYKKSKEQKK